MLYCIKWDRSSPWSTEASVSAFKLCFIVSKWPSLFQACAQEGVLDVKIDVKGRQKLVSDWKIGLAGFGPTHPPTHPLTHPPTHPPTHTPTHPPTHPLGLLHRCSRATDVTSLLSTMTDCEFDVIASGHLTAKWSDNGSATTAILANELSFVGRDDR